MLGHKETIVTQVICDMDVYVMVDGWHMRLDCILNETICNKLGVTLVEEKVREE